jgi:hypothetical protein
MIEFTPQEGAQVRRIKEMQQRYRNVFGSAEGKLVLGDILTEGHFGETLNPNDTMQVAEHNTAVRIARIAGAFDPMWIDLGMTEGKG